MAKQNYRRILISFRKRLYKFINYSLNKNDGSFYISIVRKGTNDFCCQFTSETQFQNLSHIDFDSPRPKTKKISYHSSGLVRYHNTLQNSVFFEPICSISTLNVMAAQIVPNLEKLDIHSEKPESNDTIFEIEAENTSHIQFTLAIAPWNYLPDSPHIAVRYQAMFCFIILLSKPEITIPKEFEKHFIFFSRTEGLFTNQAIDVHSALIKFHQKLNDTKGAILYSPNKNGVYKIICAVPKRIPPKLSVHFEDSNLSAETLESDTVSHVCFKVKDNHGNYIKEEVRILGFELHAEL